MAQTKCLTKSISNHFSTTTSAYNIHLFNLRITNHILIKIYYLVTFKDVYKVLGSLKSFIMVNNHINFISFLWMFCSNCFSLFNFSLFVNVSGLVDDVIFHSLYFLPETLPRLSFTIFHILI